jgi:hypothetical protein
VAGAGALAGVLIILGWLDLRLDLGEAVWRASFWIKIGYPAALAVFALGCSTRLARGQGACLPGALGIGTLTTMMMVAGAAEAFSMPPAALAALAWSDGLACVGDILLIAAPMLALVLVGLRDIDLERPALTGLACGVFCGGVAGAVDSLHCWQSSYAFVAPWFTLGVLASAIIGAVGVTLLARRRGFRLAAAE